MTRPAERMRASSAGFSLAEVVVALGILAAVLISTAGLLVLGGRMVSRGRTSSAGLAVGRTILETIDSWSFERTYRQLGCDDALASCVVDTIALEGQPWQSTPPAVSWQSLVDRDLTEGRAEIRLDALDASSLAAAGAIRVLVTVYWDEGQRQRSLPLVAVRY
jgi:hypothetical protein